MKDKFNREITYLRLSITDLCNLKCKYCVSKESEKVGHNDVLSIEEMVQIVKASINLGINKVRITGGEPLTRRGIIELVQQIAPLVNNNLGMTTNGQLLNQYATKLKKAGLCNLNVSLDTLDPQLYKMISFGHLEPVLEGLQLASKLGFKIKLNCVLQKGINDDKVLDLLEYSKTINARLRFIELMPFESTEDFYVKHFISADEIINKYHLKYLYSEGTAEYYDYQGQELGFIRPISKKFCASCNRLRVTVFGELIPCLHSSETYELKPYLQDNAQLEKAIAEIILKKPSSHHLAEGKRQSIEMIKIGG